MGRLLGLAFLADCRAVVVAVARRRPPGGDARVGALGGARLALL